MTPQEHLDRAEALLEEAAQWDKTPRAHLSRSLALLAIGHSLAALARHVQTGTAPGAFGVTTYARVADAAEHVAQDAKALLLPAPKCPGCGAPMDSGGFITDDGQEWCPRCVHSHMSQLAQAGDGS